jgi:hypothetical protein
MQLKRLKCEIKGRKLIVCDFCPVLGCSLCGNVYNCSLVNDSERELVFKIHKKMPYKTWRSIPKSKSNDYYKFVLKLREDGGETEWTHQSHSKMVTA